MHKQSIVKDIKEFLSSNYNISYNSITRNLEIDGKPVNDMVLNSVFIACKTIHSRANQKLVESILYSDYTKEYNPFLDFIETYQNDLLKENNINKLITSIVTDTPNYDMFIKKWLCSMVASIYGSHSPLMLVLCGGQNCGKTEWFRRLLPEPLQPYYAESKLDAGKDDEILMTKKLIIMDDEMGGKSKQEQKKLKEMTSKQTFSVREPYGRVSIDLNRLAMLCGTTNDNQILNDPTGNRRILPINVLSINHDVYNSINKYHLFIEVYNLYKSGYNYNLNREEILLLNQSTVEFESSCIEEEMILKHYTLPESDPEKFVSDVTNSDIVVRIKNITGVNLNPKILGLVLKKLGFTQKRKKINGIVGRFYEVLEI
ncbi:VapE domain-containing protein [Rubrolithibacter danxiaensis]|uniref:VapE domain-containing protein n=1 Tax=Rubrolithibacter danxiaensis TaxID=3390805 RepID=UPI003BF7CFC9